MPSPPFTVTWVARLDGSATRIESLPAPASIETVAAKVGANESSWMVSSPASVWIVSPLAGFESFAVANAPAVVNGWTQK